MWWAEVTSSQRSPGLGSAMALLNFAFSSVSRERSSVTSRPAGTPRFSNSRTASAASVLPPWTICPLPPENTIRALGYLRASSTALVMRSAASLSEISPRAGATLVSNAPPSTTMPSGGPPAGFHGGKRCSSGSISALPSGESPQQQARQQTLQSGAREAGREQQRAGKAEHHQQIGRPGEEAEHFRDDEEHRRTADPTFVVPARPRSGREPGPMTTALPECARTVVIGPRFRGDDEPKFVIPIRLVLSPLLLVARPGGFVGRIEPGKLCTVLDLVDDPGFEALLVRALLGHRLDEGRGDHHRAVVVGHDHVVREHS